MVSLSTEDRITGGFWMEVVWRRVGLCEAVVYAVLESEPRVSTFTPLGVLRCRR